MSDGYSIRRYRRRTSLGSAETNRWRSSVLMAVMALAGMAGILLAVLCA
ncbi:hypothetical protein [Methanoregula sp.]|nr:hypothetical protein [Methanoregula sp.]MDD5142847.1 hypothetical protein [Methanoregula sp.]